VSWDVSAIRSRILCYLETANQSATEADILRGIQFSKVADLPGWMNFEADGLHPCHLLSTRHSRHLCEEAPDAKPLLHDNRPTTLFELLRGPKHTLLLFPSADHETKSWHRLAELAQSLESDLDNLINI
jgi:hypothetical protein